MANNAVPVSVTSVRLAEIPETSCAVYAGRAFIPFMAIFVGLSIEAYSASRELKVAENDDGRAFWSGVVQKARWSVTIGLTNLFIAVLAA